MISLEDEKESLAWKHLPTFWLPLSFTDSLRKYLLTSYLVQSTTTSGLGGKGAQVEGDVLQCLSLSHPPHQTFLVLRGRDSTPPLCRLCLLGIWAQTSCPTSPSWLPFLKLHPKCVGKHARRPCTLLHFLMSLAHPAISLSAYPLLVHCLFNLKRRSTL